MIHGIGTDIVEVSRIQALLETQEKRFLARVFHPQEIAEAERRYGNDLAKAVGFYAKRFAAKEAAAKAAGCGIGELLAFTDIFVSNDRSGKPEINIMPEAASRLNFGKRRPPRLFWHLSLSDEAEYAIAFVTLEFE